MKDRETVREKLEYEIFSEQCFEQEKKEEMIENNKNELIKLFAHIYIEGSACSGCKYEPNASCNERYEECAKRIKEVLEQ